MIKRKTKRRLRIEEKAYKKELKKKLKAGETIVKPKIIEIPSLIQPFLATSDNREPDSIIPGQIKLSLESKLGTQLKWGSTFNSSSLPLPNLEKSKTISVQSEKPYYQFNITPTEADYVFKHMPEISQSTTPVQTNEIVEKLLSLENASQPEINRFNKQRVIKLLERRDGDTGSSEVQAAVFTVRIMTIEQHLQQQGNKNDKKAKMMLDIYSHKRRKILKYLKRTDLPRFVETCKVLGIDTAAVY